MAEIYIRSFDRALSWIFDATRNSQNLSAIVKSTYRRDFQNFNIIFTENLNSWKMEKSDSQFSIGNFCRCEEYRSDNEMEMQLRQALT